MSNSWVSSIECQLWISSLLYSFILMQRLNSFCTTTLQTFQALIQDKLQSHTTLQPTMDNEYQAIPLQAIYKKKRTWQFILLRSIFFLFCALKGQIARHMMANTLTYLVTCYYCCKNNHDSTAVQVKPTSCQNHAKTMGRSIAKIKETQTLTDSNLLWDSVPS